MWRFVDFIIVPVLIIYLTYEPCFAKNAIYYLEEGDTLSVIHGILNGARLHRDIYVLYGPLYYYAPAAVLAIFGATVPILRIYFLAGNAATFLLIYMLARLFIRNRFFSITASLLVVAVAHHPIYSARWGAFRFALGYLVLLLIGLLCCFPRKILAFAAGAATATAFLYNYEIGLIASAAVAAFFAYDAWMGAPREGSPKAFFGKYVLGYAVVLALYAVVLAATGSWAGFVGELVGFSGRRVWAQPIGARYVLDNFPKLIHPAFVYAVAIIWIFSKWGSARTRDKALLLAVTVYGFIFYFFCFRAVKFVQFSSSLPLVILVSFYLLEATYTHLKTRVILAGRTEARPMDIALTVVLALGLLHAAFFIPTPVGNGALWRWIRFQAVGKFNGIDAGWGTNLILTGDSVPAVRGMMLPIEQEREIRDVAESVAAFTKKDDVLFGFPDLAVFNFLCDRPQAGRFYMPAYAYMQPEWQDELLRDLERAKPPVVLMRNAVSMLACLIGRKEEMMPRVQRYILDHYRLYKTTWTISVYILKTTLD